MGRILNSFIIKHKFTSVEGRAWCYFWAILRKTSELIHQNEIKIKSKWDQAFHQNQNQIKIKSCVKSKSKSNQNETGSHIKIKIKSKWNWEPHQNQYQIKMNDHSDVLFWWISCFLSGFGASILKIIPNFAVENVIEGAEYLAGPFTSMQGQAWCHFFVSLRKKHQNWFIKMKSKSNQNKIRPFIKIKIKSELNWMWNQNQNQIKVKPGLTSKSKSNQNEMTTSKQH